MDRRRSNNPSLAASLKIITVDWFLSSTAHALPNIFRNSNIILRLTWICCFFASASYCIYSVYQSLMLFLTYPSYISTEIIQEIPTQFPAVTICNLKTINKTAASVYFSDVQFQDFIIDPQFMRSPYEYLISQQYYFRTAISLDKRLTETSRRFLGYELKDMLISCMFNYNFCDENDFTFYYHPLYGNCYTFNKGIDNNGTKINIEKVSVGGQLYGLVLELFLGDPQVETQYELNDGLLVSIHNQTAEPFTDGNKIMIPSNSDTDLVVSRNYITKLEYPYGDCLKDTSNGSKFSSFYFDYIVNTLDSLYSQTHCYSLCIQKNIIDTCNCSNVFLPLFKNETSFCVGITETRCMLQLVNRFGDVQASTECKNACPFECDSVEYETSIFRSYYPSEFYKNILAETPKIKYSNVSFDDIGKAMVKVNIYYKSMLYKSTEEQISTTTQDFFSNIGGTLGLYLGISLLSVFEIFELGFNLMIAFCTSFKKKNTVIHVQPTATVEIERNKGKKY